MNNWIIKKEAALSSASFISISWIKIVQYLPCKVYSNILYPYSHLKDADLVTINHVEFTYRTGTTLHKRKGHYQDLQEKEELIVFYTNQGEKAVTIKNLRAHVAATFRPVPLIEAERIGILQHDILFAPDNDLRPVLEKNKTRWIYKSYSHYPYRIIDHKVLDLIKTIYDVKRTDQEWFYISLQTYPGRSIAIQDQIIVCTQTYTLELQGRENVRNINRFIGDFEFISKKEMYQ